MQQDRSPLAPELYALTQGTRCEGKHECHWCGSPCGRIYIHDGPVPLPFVKNDLTAKRPANPYVCNGCRLFRRPRNTVRFLNGKDYQDGKCLMDFSLLLTDGGIWGVRKEDLPHLENIIFHPPLRFALCLVDPGQKNCLQLGIVNDFQRIQADTPLRFTHNNIPHTYSVYELRSALQSGDFSGKEPGCRVLATSLDLSLAEKRGRGRPTKEEQNDPGRVLAERDPVRRSA